MWLACLLDVASLLGLLFAIGFGLLNGERMAWVVLVPGLGRELKLYCSGGIVSFFLVFSGAPFLDCAAAGVRLVEPFARSYNNRK